MQFETLKTVADPGVFDWGWERGDPSYDLFTSACKAVFPAPKEIGVHRLRNTWSSLLSQLVDNYGDNSVDNWLFISTSQIQWNWKWEADAEQEELKPWIVWWLMSGCQDLHSYALTPWPWQWRWRNLYNRCYQTQEEDVPKGRRLNYNVQPRLVGGAVGVCVGVCVWGGGGGGGESNSL